MAKDKELAAAEESDKKAKDKKSPAAEKSDKKDNKSKKENGFVKWFKDLRTEWKKVVWPTKKTVFNNSVVVFATMIVFALFTFLLDTGFLKLLEFAISGKS